MLVPQFFKVANRRLSVQILLVIPQRPLFASEGSIVACTVPQALVVMSVTFPGGLLLNNGFRDVQL